MPFREVLHLAFSVMAECFAPLPCQYVLLDAEDFVCVASAPVLLEALVMPIGTECRGVVRRCSEAPSIVFVARKEILGCGLAEGAAGVKGDVFDYFCTSREAWQEKGGVEGEDVFEFEAES